jgi:nitrogen fixation protein NifU and related proteins
MKQEDLLKEAGYSNKAIKYFLEKEGVGIIKKFNASARYKGSCGDIMEFFLEIKNKIIKNARFQAIGCAGSYSAGSALTKIVKNKSLKEVEKINEEDIINHLGKIPKSKIHCAKLALNTLKKAIRNYKNKNYLIL